MKIKIALIICVVLSILTACVKYDAEPFSGKTLPRRTEYSNDWLYYNLTKDTYLNPHKSESGDSIKGTKSIIIEGKQFNRNDWDIAFNRYNIRTNSGLSGTEKGGVYDMGLVAYEDIVSLTQIPDNAEFIKDSVVKITMSEKMWNKLYFPINKEPWFDPNSGPKQMKSTANKLLSSALMFSGPPPSYTPSNHVYIIRTADGMNYFKLQIISWYDQYKNIGQRGGKISFKCDQLLKK